MRYLIFAVLVVLCGCEVKFKSGKICSPNEKVMKVEVDNTGPHPTTRLVECENCIVDCGLEETKEPK